MTLYPDLFHARRAPGVLVALALAAGIAACGSSAPDNGVVSLSDPSASPGASASPAAPVDPEEAMLAFSTCMREHGVDISVAAITDAAGGGVAIPGGEAPAPGELQPPTKAFDPKAMQAADEACRHLLPTGGMGDPNATMDPALADQLLKFAQCMRENGVDMPDPQFSGGGVTVQIGGSAALGGDGSGDPGGGALAPFSETFQAAQEACAAALPGGAPFMVGGPGGPGPGAVPAQPVNP